MIKKIICVILSITSISTTLCKVLIFTYAFNRPDFIEIQHKTFKKFLLDDYEFVVFIDAFDKDMRQKIITTCNACNLKFVIVPQEIHCHLNSTLPPNAMAAERNCNVVQYSLDTIGFKHNDILVLLDSDLFLIKELSIIQLLEGYNLAGFSRQCRDSPFHDCKKIHPHHPPIEYLWIGLIFLNMRTLPNKEIFSVHRGPVLLNNQQCINLDSGGYTYYYLRENPQVSCKRIPRINLKELLCKQCIEEKHETCSHNTHSLLQLGLSNQVINLAQTIPFDMREGQSHRGVELFEGETFFHYKAGTNYTMQSQSFCNRKLKIFNDFINSITPNKEI